MNTEQAKGWARRILTFFAGYLAAWGSKKGIDAGTITAFFNSEIAVSVIAFVISAAWGVFSKTKIGLILAAATVPEVPKVHVTDPELARELRDKGAEAEIVVAR